MFKIKTKKDIQIENLKAEVSMLERILNSPNNIPRFTHTERDVKTLEACTVLHEEEPIEYAKSIILNGFTKEIEPYVHFDIRDDKPSFGKRIVIGRVQIVENRRF